MLVTKVNFLTLLSILNTIQQVGVAQSVCEGGEMGDKSIPNLKQRINHMKPNFTRNAMKSYCNDQAVISLFKESIQNLKNDTKIKWFELHENLDNIQKPF